MAKVILICGKICSGKSVYAKDLIRNEKAVLLSVDEIMLALFGTDAGEKHDMYTEKLQAYLLEKSAEIVISGIDVVLDWGFWTREKRREARDFFERRGIRCEFHYLDVDDETWAARINKRNKAVGAGSLAAYPIDAGILEKFTSLFELPTREEIDLWL